MSFVIDLVNIYYRVSSIIYVALKIEKNKNENKPDRLSKYWNINPKKYTRFLSFLMDLTPSKNQ